MNILLLGNGGREHAFAWKISKSKILNKLYIAPGNAGTALLGENCTVLPTDFKAIEQFALAHNITMIIPASEAPLVEGIYDYFAAQKSTAFIKIIGPSLRGAQLEGSKDFSKLFMKKYKIPTAQYATFSTENLENGLSYIDAMQTPIVLKADGLAAGKGVIISPNKEHAQLTLKQMLLHQKFGDAGSKVVIEEFLSGIEFSVFVLTDGTSFQILPIAKDYKRIGEKDTGLNTGGMGAVTPLPFVDEILMQKVVHKIVLPTLAGLQTEQILYKGFLYFGLIKVQDEPMVIEYNCRMGDPETQVVLPMIEDDLVPYLDAVGQNKLAEMPAIKIKKGACCTTVIASEGYPENYESHKEISGLNDLPENCVAFHAGTKVENGKLLSNGGRVMAISAFGSDMAEACKASREGAAHIKLSNKYFRQDIGQDIQNMSKNNRLIFD